MMDGTRKPNRFYYKHPFQPKIHEILGLIAVDVGNFVLATQSLELALRFDPTNVSIRQSLDHMPKPR